MGWLWGSEDTKAVGNAVTGTIESINYALSGDLPPDIRLKLEEAKAKMQEVESNQVKALWDIDSRIPWWESSRSIVMLWLNFHSVIMVYIVLYTNIEFNAPAVTALLSLTGVVDTAFFGSKGWEYVKAGRTP